MHKTLIFIYLAMFSLFPDGKEINYFNKSLLKEIEYSAPETVLKEIDFGLNAGSGFMNGKFFGLTESKTEIKYIYEGRVNSCRSGGCSNPAFSQNTEYEYFDYFILFDSTGTVLKVKVFNYQATRGQEITVKGWLKQFAGYDGTKILTVGKQIDGISGATVSVYGITNDIQEKTSALKNHLHSIQ